MCWAGPNSAFSNVDKAVGVPSHTNLINADTLSKQYWLNLGLLGFLLISPMMLTSRVRMPSCEGVREVRAVMITRMTPNNQSQTQAEVVKKEYIHFMR